jgi:hypothetical protein
LRCSNYRNLIAELENMRHYCLLLLLFEREMRELATAALPLLRVAY